MARGCRPIRKPRPPFGNQTIETIRKPKRNHSETKTKNYSETKIKSIRTPRKGTHSETIPSHAFENHNKTPSETETEHIRKPKKKKGRNNQEHPAPGWPREHQEAPGGPWRREAPGGPGAIPATPYNTKCSLDGPFLGHPVLYLVL